MLLASAHKSCVCVCILSCVQLFATPRTIACQAPLSMEYCSIGLSFPSPGDLPKRGIESVSVAAPVLAGRFFTSRTTREAQLGWACMKPPGTNVLYWKSPPGGNESMYPAEQCGKAMEWGARKTSQRARGVTGPHLIHPIYTLDTETHIPASIESPALFTLFHVQIESL